MLLSLPSDIHDGPAAGYLHEAEVVPVLGALLLNYLMADAVAGQWYG